VLDDRTKLTAKKITEFLKESGDRFQKTIRSARSHETPRLSEPVGKNGVQ
jgi:hypothetical protein